MKKYKIIFKTLITLVLIGFIYPLINNDKTIRLDDELVVVKETNIIGNDSLISYSIIEPDSTEIQINKNVVKDITKISKKYQDYNFVGIFNESNDTIIKVYHSELKEFIFFFRFNKHVHFFKDSQDNNFIPFIALLSMVFFVLILIFFTSDDIKTRFFVVVVMLFIYELSSYLYTTFETGWISIPLLLICVYIGFNFEDIEDDYDDARYRYEHIKSKENSLTNNYDKLLKDNH